MTKPTREEYECMQEGSQHFNESYEHFCDRVQSQEAAAVGDLSRCKYALDSIAAYKKNGEPGILWFCTDHTGKFAFFPNAKDAAKFAETTIDGVKKRTYRKWDYTGDDLVEIDGRRYV